MAAQPALMSHPCPTLDAVSPDVVTGRQPVTTPGEPILPANRLPAWMERPFLGGALILTCLLMMAITAIEFTRRGGGGMVITLNDYDAFVIAGRLFWEGHLAQAYDAEAMMAAQQRMAGSLKFTPWTYPPHFNLVVIPLALLPLATGYLAWIGATLAGFVLALRRLAGPHLVLCLLALFPAIFVCVRNGQNGLFTGALLALFCHWQLKGRAIAGLPLALLTVKPHLLPAVGLYLLLTRQWRVIAVAAIATLALLAGATALFGVGIWGAFVAAVGDAGDFLGRGAYPLYRMVSLYAALFRLGAPPAIALACQIGFGLACLAGVALAWRAGLPQRQLLAVALMASPMLSPYAYDYDLTLLAVALALLAPDIAAAARPLLAHLLVLAGWIAGGSGLVLNALYRRGAPDPAQAAELAHAAPSLGIFGVMAFCALALWLARQRDHRGAPGRA